MTTTTEETTEPEGNEVTLESLQAQIRDLRSKRMKERQAIVDIAQRYARQHNLCGVVDTALTEAGLLGGGKTVTAEVIAPITLTFGVDEEMSEEEIRDYLQEKMSHQNLVSIKVENLGQIRAISNGRVRRDAAQARTNGDIEIVSITEGAMSSEGGTNMGGGHADWATPPPGFLALYTHPEGRKAHFVRALPEEQRDNGDHGLYRRTYDVPINGITFVTPRNTIASCINGYFSGWRVNSPRAQGVGTVLGICEACRQRALRDYGWRFNGG